jgi:hypothetical protein
MPSNLPYLASYKNVGKLFKNIANAKTPDAFTNPFLQTTLGLKSTGDRPLIPLLRAMGFLDAAGKPTTAYGLLKNSATAKLAIADATRSAYKPLFDANEEAHKLPQDELRGLVAQVAGTDSAMTTKIVGTLNALLKAGDFGGKTPEQQPPADEKAEKKNEESGGSIAAKNQLSELRPEFHFNIQVHLPSNATEEAYLSIFTALRKAFK